MVNLSFAFLHSSPQRVKMSLHFFYLLLINNGVLILKLIMSQYWMKDVIIHLNKYNK